MKFAITIWIATAILVWYRLPSFDVVTLATLADIIAAGFIGMLGLFIGILAGAVAQSFERAGERARRSAPVIKRRD